jgi:hypothetical protein
MRLLNSDFIKVFMHDHSAFLAFLIEFARYDLKKHGGGSEKVPQRLAIFFCPHDGNPGHLTTFLAFGRSLS